MKTLFIDCGMGAAGDMLTAALLELLPDPSEQEKFIQKLNNLGIPEVTFQKEKSVKCGIMGTHISVKVHGEEEHSHDHYHEDGHVHTHEHEHHHEHEHSHEHEHHIHERHHEHEHSHEHNDMHGHHSHEHEHEHGYHHHSSLHDIEHIVRGHLSLPDEVKDDIMAVYQLIADAESKAHGKPVTEIHFHEVGTMDAIADITAVCLLLHEIAPEQIIVSPIHAGSGQVRCAHGILPVPAPATAHILRDVPIYGGHIQGELCTPTGAALLKHFATRFGDMPVMVAQAIGYGMGQKDFAAANCVRVLLGETAETGDTVAELCCNLDDMTGEAVGFAMEELLAAGALEVYTVPIGMKKSRPGLLLCTMCRPEDRDKMLRLIFKHTTTLGVREHITNRYTLKRSVETVTTAHGNVRKKISRGYGIVREKYEYEDLADIARKKGMSIAEVEEQLHLISPKP